MKLKYTKSEVKKLKEEIYFTQQEEKVLEYWMLDYSIIKIGELIHTSISTVSRRKKNILNKINGMKSNIS